VTRTRTAFALALLAAAAAVPIVVAAQEQPSGSTLRVTVAGLRSQRGNIGCAIFGSREGFPGDAERAVSKVRGRWGRSAGVATCTFENLAPGRYAVAVGHDENENGRLDKNIVGIPVEGWGVSNNAPARMGPPAWDEAVFDVEGSRQLILVTVRYGL
jgi:uncharacterized protein (DUF2141 family)